MSSVESLRGASSGPSDGLGARKKSYEEEEDDEGEEDEEDEEDDEDEDEEEEEEEDAEGVFRTGSPSESGVNCISLSNHLSYVVRALYRS